MNTYDIVIIGCGPGGFDAARYAISKGLSVCVIEKDALGGACLNRGCIPTKNLIQCAGVFREMQSSTEFGVTAGDVAFSFAEMVKRGRRIVDGMRKTIPTVLGVRQEKCTIIEGQAQLRDPHTVRVVQNQDQAVVDVTARNIILATGSLPQRSIPGLAAGQNQWDTAEDVMWQEELPESICIVGGGVIGVEMADLLAVLGVRVHVVEILPHLVHQVEASIAAGIQSNLKRKGVSFFLEHSVSNVDKHDHGYSVEVQGWTSGEKQQLEVAQVMLAIGRIPQTQQLGLGVASIDCDDKGFVKVNEWMQTSQGHVYAIGDIVNTPQYAHVASAEGMLAARHIAGSATMPIDYHMVPSVIFTNPPAASVGQTEQESEGAQASRMPYGANAKNLIGNHKEGFVKLLTKDTTLRGAHIYGHEAPELIHEYVIAMSAGISPQSFSHIVHAHPTMAELLWQAYS